MQFLKEYRRGYSSTFKFECKMCGTTSFITSENESMINATNYWPINTALVNDSLAVDKCLLSVTEI